MIQGSSYHDLRQRVELGPEEDGRGEEEGEEEYEREGCPGLAGPHLQSVRTDDHSVTVSSDRHDRQRGHEHCHAGEDLHHRAEGEDVRQGPGHVEPVQEGEGDGADGEDIGDGQVENENISGCPGLSPAEIELSESD